MSVIMSLSPINWRPAKESYRGIDEIGIHEGANITLFLIFDSFGDDTRPRRFNLALSDLQGQSLYSLDSDDLVAVPRDPDLTYPIKRRLR
jgi:hypothetical protein